MPTSRRSITFKVIIGYLMLAAAIGLAYYFIYPELKNFINPQEREQTTNKKLTYISNALSYLYEAETLGRTAMSTGSMEEYEEYKLLVDSINAEINTLQNLTPEHSSELDSIQVLLSKKTENMLSMISLRKEQLSRNFYDEAISQLTKDDIYYEDYASNPVIDSLDPEFKETYVEFYNFLRRDNIEQDKSLRNMAETVRATLAEIEKQKKDLEIELISQENKLLSNDRNINNKIRTLLVSLERESFFANQALEAKLNTQLDKVTETLKIIGITSTFLALIVVFLIFKDASKNQKYSKELEESNAYTQSLLKSREQLMATITHDMRSPLNTIIGFTDLLDKTSLNATQENYLTHVQKSSDYVLRLVNDLLDFSKLEAGGVSIEHVAFNPQKLIEDVVLVAIPSHAQVKVSVVTQFGEATNRFYKSDPFRIKQILSNLVTNAYKFTEEGKITVSVNYEEKSQSQLHFTVTDTGIGIPEEKQHLIFKEFSQANEDIEKKYGGFGLGLAITSKLVELLGGSIDLKSKEGEGSTFSIHIPVELAKEQNNSSTNQDIPQLSLKHILIVDDEEAQRTLAAEIISQLGITYNTAHNGEEALVYLKSNNYDAILTDIQMPKIDGIELVKRLRAQEKYAKTPIYALSGNTKLNGNDYKYYGFNGRLKKPYTPAQLVKLLSGKQEKQIFNPVNKPIETPSSKGYSLQELSLFAGNDPDSLYSILEVFIESTHQNIKELELYIDKNNTTEINRIAHKMLPMMRQLHVIEVIPILEQLESNDLNKKSRIVVNSIGSVAIKKIRDLIKNLERDIKV